MITRITDWFADQFDRLLHRTPPLNRVADQLAERRFTQREVEAIVAARLADLRNEPTITHEDLTQMIMERRADNATN